MRTRKCSRNTLDQNKNLTSFSSPSSWISVPRGVSWWSFVIIFSSFRLRKNQNSIPRLAVDRRNVTAVYDGSWKLQSSKQTTLNKKKENNETNRFVLTLSSSGIFFSRERKGILFYNKYRIHFFLILSFRASLSDQAYCISRHTL